MDKIKSKIKYAYFDLDGTLLTSDKKLTQETLDSLNWLRKQGIKIGIATGRPYYLALEIIKAIKPDLPTVSINGNLIYDDTSNESRYQKKHNPETLKKFLDFAKKNQLNFLAYTTSEIQYKEFINSKHLLWLQKNKKNQPEDCKTPLVGFKNDLENILKVLIMLKDSDDYDEKAVFDFCSSFPDSYLVKSQTGLLDFMPLGINKASGLTDLEKKGIINLQQTIVFGDSNNDIDMLKSASYSVAMKNSNKNVCDVADYVTKYTNNEEGVGKFIYDFF